MDATENKKEDTAQENAKAPLENNNQQDNQPDRLRSQKSNVIKRSETSKKKLFKNDSLKSQSSKRPNLLKKSDAKKASRASLIRLYAAYGNLCPFILRCLLFFIQNTSIYAISVIYGLWAKNENQWTDLTYVIMIGIVIVVYVINRFFMTLCMTWMIDSCAIRMNKVLLRFLMKQNMKFFFEEDIGEIVNSGVRHFNVIDDELNVMIAYSQGLYMFVVFFVPVFSLTAIYMMIPMALSFLHIFCLTRKTISTINNFQKLSLRSSDQLMSTVADISNNIQVLRAYGKEHHFIDDYVQRTRELETSKTSLRIVMIYCESIFQFWSILVILCYLIGNVTFKMLGVDRFANAILFGTLFSRLPNIPEYFGASYWTFQECYFRLESLRHIDNFVDILGRNKKKKSASNKKARIKMVEAATPRENAAQSRGSDKIEYKEEILKKGKISFENVDFRYSEKLPLVLKNISFEVNQGEKLGLVGRTGSGKSSLLLLLSKLLEYERGSVEVDGKKIDNIDPIKLRKKMAIIPQNPVLLFDTLRKNVDPFEGHDEDEVVEALVKTRFVETLYKEGQELGAKMTKKQIEIRTRELLDEDIQGAGLNLSLGQRQIICVAKAILSDPVVLILDEATANLDMESDEFIQKLIREEFKNKTILAVAHRVNTILDFDRILVLGNGEIIEFDTPENLLQRNSLFKKMKEQNC